MNTTFRMYVLFKKKVTVLRIINFADNDNVMTPYIEISAGNLT